MTALPPLRCDARIDGSDPEFLGLPKWAKVADARDKWAPAKFLSDQLPHGDWSSITS
jgi:hypothetical protein